MAAAISQQTNDNRVAQDEKELRDQTPKLPSSKFKITLVILLEMLLIQDESESATNLASMGKLCQVA
jgi:hypothetical protein